ncbi:sodium-dependent glucose transporter 1-like protein [Dinothrombium tinctorium]|uniref:Sodium-dependent glucose transporter 1-like protein n=1 Tax=Dinothrombium tinctorium TaxID=1965070 RepID=A0A3S3P8D9_9ACAR|nr:sodium-dependent glucose transporter 1-like protein [Dinothrombium tinctorium]
MHSTQHNLAILYLIVSCTAIITFTALLLLEICKPYKKPKRSLGGKNQIQTKNINVDEAESLVHIDLPRSYYIIFVLLSCLLLCAWGTIESNTLTYLPTFLHYTNLALSTKESALMVSTCNLIYLACRLLSIALASRLKPLAMLYTSFTILLFGSIFMLFFGLETIKNLWISIVLVSLGCSWNFPAIFSLIEERIDVTNSIGGLFIFSTSIFGKKLLLKNEK